MICNYLLRLFSRARTRTCKFRVKFGNMKAFLLIFAGRLRSLMDRISDSGSDGCGSIPHGGTIFSSRIFSGYVRYLMGI